MTTHRDNSPRALLRRAAEEGPPLPWARKWSVRWWHQFLRRAAGVPENIPYGRATEMYRQAQQMARLWREIR